MKIRTDFVTNSSSSSFLLARSSKLTEQEKAAIIAFVENNLLGDEILSADSSDEEVAQCLTNEENYWFGENEKMAERVRKIHAEGKSLYSGYVSFEEADYGLREIYKSLWDTLEDNGAGDFEVLDGDLYY